MTALHDIVKKGSTNRSVVVRIIDSTDGTPELSVVWNTSGIDMWYRREGAARVAITEATLAALTTAHADGGFLHVSDGAYRLDLPDAAFATAAEYVDFGGTVTGMVVIGGRVRLVDVDLEDAVRMGQTALPNAAADAAGGLPISDAGGLDLDTQLAATNEITAARMGTLTDWINGGRLDLLLDAIPTTAMRGTDGANTTAPLSAGEVNAEVVDALGVDMIALPGQEAPPLTPTLIEAVGWLYKVLRNHKEQTATQWALMADNGTTVDAKATVSDDATTAIKQEIVTGP